MDFRQDVGRASKESFLIAARSAALAHRNAWLVVTLLVGGGKKEPNDPENGSSSIV